MDRNAVVYVTVVRLKGTKIVIARTMAGVAVLGNGHSDVSSLHVADI